MFYEHTRGPWVCHSGMVWKPDGSPDGIPICHMDRDTPKTTPCERDKNAEFIATAPEMESILIRLSEKVKRATRIRRSHGRISAEDWRELDMLTGEARTILVKAKGKP